MSKRTLHIWTIYNKPADFPGKYVARRFEFDQPTSDYFVSEQLEKVREYVKRSIEITGQGSPFLAQRHPSDDPVILESWL